MASEHLFAASVSLPQHPQHRPESWVAPSPGEVKINFHSLWDKKRHGAGVCAIVRNHLGELVDGVSLFCPAGSALCAEAKAAALVSRLAQAYSDKERVLFECCSNIIVEGIVNRSNFGDAWVIRDDLSETAKNCGNLKSFSWSTISKEANEAALELCKKLVQHDDEVPIDWLRPPPSWVVEPPDWLNFIIAKEMPEWKSETKSN